MKRHYYKQHGSSIGYSYSRLRKVLHGKTNPAKGKPNTKRYTVRCSVCGEAFLAKDNRNIRIINRMPVCLKCYPNHATRREAQKQAS